MEPTNQYHSVSSPTAQWYFCTLRQVTRPKENVEKQYFPVADRKHASALAFGIGPRGPKQNFSPA